MVSKCLISTPIALEFDLTSPIYDVEVTLIFLAFASPTNLKTFGVYNQFY